MAEYNTDTHDVLQYAGGVSKCDLNNILRCSQFLDDDFLSVLGRSPYYDMESLDSVLSENIEKFSILSLNIQSINSKFDNLCALISLLSEKKVLF